MLTNTKQKRLVMWSIVDAQLSGVKRQMFNKRFTCLFADSPQTMWSGPILNPTLQSWISTLPSYCATAGGILAEPAVILSTGLRFKVLNLLNQLKLSRLDVNCAQLTSALVKCRAAGVGNVVMAHFAHG